MSELTSAERRANGRALRRITDLPKDERGVASRVLRQKSMLTTMEWEQAADRAAGAVTGNANKLAVRRIHKYDLLGEV